jgi:RND family efflux transporter MFP subunit
MLILVLLGFAGYLLAVRGGLATRQAIKLTEMIQTRPDVRVARVSVESGRSADAVVVAQGYLESRRQAKIGARAPGRIEAVHVEEGVRVESNEVLAVLEHADLVASVSAANATLSRSRAALAEQEIAIARGKRDLDRATKMLSSKSASEADFDKAKFDYDAAVARRDSLRAEVELAEARVREAEQLKENMFIRAPFNGTVISKDAEVGESIMPGGMGEASGRGSVVTIADLEHLEVECDVKEDYISRVFDGQLAEVAVDAVPGRRYRGRVRKIIPMGDRARATIKVKVAITDVDDHLFPEMSSTVYFLPSDDESAAVPTDRPRMFCPSSAVVTKEEGNIVWIVDADDRVQPVDIMVGATRDGRTEILTGLTGNERIVVDPPELQSKQLVRISQ